MVITPIVIHDVRSSVRDHHSIKSPNHQTTRIVCNRVKLLLIKYYCYYYCYHCCYYYLLFSLLLLFSWDFLYFEQRSIKSQGKDNWTIPFANWFGTQPLNCIKNYIIFTSFLFFSISISCCICFHRIPVWSTIKRKK